MSGAKPSFYREKTKPSSKYEAKVRSLHQNMKPSQRSLCFSEKKMKNS
jgi:hypothetical protein